MRNLAHRPRRRLAPSPARPVAEWPRRRWILEVPVDDLTPEEAVDRILQFVREGRPRHVVTVNPEFVMIAREDAAFREILQTADLALADGVGLTLAVRLRGRPLRGRVTGVDTVQRLAAVAAREGLRLFLLGARPGVAGRAAAALERAHPGLRIAGSFAGSPMAADEPAIIERVRAARPHILFVAYGAPWQDFWIRRNLDRLGVPVAMGVGGAFDYIAGRVPRAPAWMRRFGLEWLYRLARQPWRWRRMLRLPRFAWAALRGD